MVAVLLLLKSIGGIMTMHFYVPPRPPDEPGWRVFGFARRKRN
jgi:hypothetical protein